MARSSGKDAKEFCMIWILERDRLSTPSWIREQASIQLRHPWHFSMSTRRYPSAGGISAGVRRVGPVSGGLVGASALGDAGVLVDAGLSVGAGLSSVAPHPPIPATTTMAPVTLMKSRRVILVSFPF
jgi:hypothetical protein